MMTDSTESEEEEEEDPQLSKKLHFIRNLLLQRLVLPVRRRVCVKMTRGFMMKVYIYVGGSILSVM